MNRLTGYRPAIEAQLPPEPVWDPQPVWGEGPWW